MIDYHEVEAARDLAGLRLVLTRGVPNPWGEAAKGIFRVKGIAFTAVSQWPGEPNAALRDWTGQTSGPCAVYADEPPKVSWAPILHLAERLAPVPSLLPAEADDRVRMLGLCEEIAGEDGLGWHRRRLSMLGWNSAAGPLPSASAQRIQQKYDGRATAANATAVSITRMLTVVHTMAALAEAATGPYLIGGRMSALDIMWAGFCNMFVPLPEEICAIPAPVRALYTVDEPTIYAAFTPALLALRDFMYTRHMDPPTTL